MAVLRSERAPSTSQDDEVKPVVKEDSRSTGNKWTDFQLAFRRISLWDDLANIGQIPCARNSLLSGIASGFGIGVIRGINSKPFVAANWAMGTFLIVSVGTWNYCRASIRREREQVRVVVEQMAERRMRKAGVLQQEKAPEESPGKS